MTTKAEVLEGRAATRNPPWHLVEMEGAGWWLTHPATCQLADCEQHPLVRDVVAPDLAPRVRDLGGDIFLTSGGSAILEPLTRQEATAWQRDFGGSPRLDYTADPITTDRVKHNWTAGSGWPTFRESGVPVHCGVTMTHAGGHVTWVDDWQVEQVTWTCRACGSSLKSTAEVHSPRPKG